jgi:stage V sporulation protein B
MFNLVISVLTPVATSFMPKLSLLSAKNDRNEFLLTLNRLLTVTLLISVPASISFYFYSFDLLDVLFSVQSSAVGAESLICLSMGLCFLSVLTVTNTALESKGKIYATVISLMLGCIVKVVASYRLIGIQGIGILGAPLGTVLSYALSLITSLVFLEASGVRTYAVPKMLVYGLAGAISFYLPYKMIYSTALLGSSFLSMMFALAISVACYFAILFIGVVFARRFSVFNLHKKI